MAHDHGIDHAALNAGVLVLDAAGKLQRRVVSPGWESTGRVVILAGLHVGERVVEQGGHLLESLRPELF